MNMYELERYVPIYILVLSSYPQQWIVILTQYEKGLLTPCWKWNQAIEKNEWT